MALQVHARPRRFRKFLRSAGPAARYACSLTVEAAAAFPLFLFALYLLILPMRMMRTSMQMQQVCEQTCEILAEAAYMQQLAAAAAADARAAEEAGTAADSEGAGSSGTSAGKASGAAAAPGNTAASGEGAASLKTIGSANGGSAEKRSEEADALIKWLSTQGAATLIGTAAAAAIEDENVEDLISWRSGYMVDGEMIRLTLDYRYRLPFFGLGGLRQSVTASRRAWVGRSEGGISNGPEDREEDDEIVYVGKSSTRYHASPSCHYLSNHSMKPVSYASLESLRNSGGSRYKPCTRCGKGAHPGTVYIMPSGEVWHSDPDCSAISAYAHAVRKSEVEHLGPCSYCCH